MPMPSFYHGSKILKNEHIAKCFIINIFSHSTATLFSARCEPIYIYIGLHLALTETVCGIIFCLMFRFNLSKSICSQFREMAYFKYLVKLGVLPERQPCRQIIQYIPKMMCRAINQMWVYCFIVEFLKQNKYNECDILL